MYTQLLTYHMKSEWAFQIRNSSYDAVGVIIHEIFSIMNLFNYYKIYLDNILQSKFTV